MNDHQIKQLAAHLTVSDTLKTIACIHYKVAFESLTAILVNNSATEMLPTRTFIPNIARGYVKPLVQYSTAEIKYRLRNYYKFMFVRHPFDRILSAWRDKLVIEMEDHHGNYYWQLLPRILQQIHPELIGRAIGKDLNTIQIPFSDILLWLKQGGWDMHFQGPYDKWCHPCVLKYDYIGKTETFEKDIEYIIDNHMTGRGKKTKRNSWSKDEKEKGAFSKLLKEYRNVSDDMVQFLSDKYLKDFYQFGYTFAREKEDVVIRCTGNCC